MVKDIAIVIIKNSKNQYYVHRRRHDKKYAPGLFGLGAGGKIEKGETAFNGAAREFREELGEGIDIDELTYLDQFSYDDGSGERVRKVFYIEHEGPFQPTTKEFIIEETGWREEGEVDNLDLEGKLCPDTSIAWRKYKELRLV